MFKDCWEKTSTICQFPEVLLVKMVSLACPDKELISSELISGGCANLNFKIQLKNEKCPLILRVYLRDKNAAYREQKLAVLLKETLPVPLIYYVGDLEGYRFALTEFREGISLRDLLLSDELYNLNSIMSEVGTILSKITAYEFSEAGFFDNELNVLPYKASGVIKFARDCLSHPTVVSVLSAEIISAIRKAIEKYRHFLPSENEKHLVHGDFDPSNILVQKCDGIWKVNAVLDWEFSFSGSYLWDVSNMLRYAHKMPPEFQDSFIEALEKGRVKLQSTWHKAIHLLNLSSLLDCLKRSDPLNHPHRCADICDLITHILPEME